MNEEGEFFKVGSTCVKDFTGVDPNKFFKMFQFINNTIECFGGDESEFSGGRAFHRNPENYVVYDIDEIWTITKGVLDIDEKYIKSEWEIKEVGIGYRSRTEEVRSNPGESTSDKVKEVLNRQRYRKDSDVENKYYLPKGSVDTELVEGMREWLKNREVRIHTRTEWRHVTDENGNGLDEQVTIEYENEYDSKLKAFTEKKRTRRFDIGFLSYMVETYKDFLLTLGTPESNHVGVVGEKSPIEVTVTMVKGIETEFGWSNLYKMVDQEGNVFSKFGTINGRYIDGEGDQIEEGTKLKFNVEIKAHKEYRGKKETQIGRVSKYPTPKKSKRKKVSLN